MDIWEGIKTLIANRIPYETPTMEKVLMNFEADQALLYDIQFIA
jgi:hypothetical protein